MSSTMGETKTTRKKQDNEPKPEQKSVHFGEVKKMKLGLLKKRLADYNPRKISAEAKRGLSASIDRFGLVEFPVYNQRTKRLVGGHQRISDLVERGLPDDTLVPVIVVDLPDVEEKVLNITLNNHNLMGEFDPLKLSEVFESLERELTEVEFDSLRLPELAAEFVFSDEDTEYLSRPSLEALEEEHGDGDVELKERLVLRLSPAVAESFRVLLARQAGEDDDARVLALIQAASLNGSV